MLHEPLSLSAAFLFGLLGGAHCIGMCGGMMSALTLSTARQNRPLRSLTLLLAYNGGRIASYTLAGVIIGSLGWLLRDSLNEVTLILRLLAAGMLILMALYLANWWHGLTRVEALGRHLWRHIQPLTRHLMPVRHPGQALLLGALWGWLPCGLVYSVLIWAATATSWQQAGLIMLCFGLGTLPALLVTGALAQQVGALIRNPATRTLAALMIITFAIWLLWDLASVFNAGAHAHSSH